MEWGYINGLIWMPRLTITMMEQSFVERFEVATQELHTARQQISVLNATVAHLSEENAELQKELSILTAKEKDDKVRIKAVSDTCQFTQGEVDDLTERLEEALEERDQFKKKMEELELSNCKTSEEGKLSVCMCQTESAVLQENISQLKHEMELKKGQLENAVADVHNALLVNTSMRSEMEELNMELECLQSQISSQCNIIQCQREELDGLKSQGEIESSCMDTNRKGNSLFSEVEDRRVMVETQMVKTLDKAQRLEKRLKKEQKENQRLKNQVSLMMRQSLTGTSDKTVRALESDLEDSKSQVLKLTKQLTEQESSKKSPSEPSINLRLSDDETPMMSYLKATVLQLQKENKALEKQRNDFEVQSIQLDFLWTQKKNEARALKTEKDRLADWTAHLTSVIDSLKEEPESSEKVSLKDTVKNSQTNPSKENIKSELLDRETQKQPSECNDSALAGLLNLGVENDSAKSVKSDNTISSASQDLRSLLLGSKSKTVTFAADPNIVLSEIDLNGIECEVDRNDEESKLKRSHGRGSGAASGKYRSVTYVKMEDTQSQEEAPECKQQ